MALGPQRIPAEIKRHRYRTGVLRLYTKQNDKNPKVWFLVLLKCAASFHAANRGVFGPSIESGSALITALFHVVKM